ncbi:hypothetical protein EIN_281170 [Entamoeba invadens IP1]|uniref:Uncharacterized protein n=1 Tax=Entamoeba invadens IP1 TaxID=370355 RepID=A0A0A1TZW7_ENTIV|nr:hypothetical protein EIN_281170 [Entamoeba invadens IP1]ELP85756.1 hypothetical protein EIN_281170 [Entamoeba invadens IP1]|eukprot:XP_004185102.1 hypothetical protein EIN_281170 [Entamoeba invadens IP1]
MSSYLLNQTVEHDITTKYQSVLMFLLSQTTSFVVSLSSYSSTKSSHFVTIKELTYFGDDIFTINLRELVNERASQNFDDLCKEKVSKKTAERRVVYGKPSDSIHFLEDLLYIIGIDCFCQIGDKVGNTTRLEIGFQNGTVWSAGDVERVGESVNEYIYSKLNGKKEVLIERIELITSLGIITGKY